jgi:hypothetical protein
MRALTACAIILLTCVWLNAPSAQTSTAIFDANGNAVAPIPSRQDRAMFEATCQRYRILAGGRIA